MPAPSRLSSRHPEVGFSGRVRQGPSSVCRAEAISRVRAAPGIRRGSVPTGTAQPSLQATRSGWASLPSTQGHPPGDADTFLLPHKQHHQQLSHLRPLQRAVKKIRLFFPSLHFPQKRRRLRCAVLPKQASGSPACCLCGCAGCEAYLTADGINDLYLQEQGEEG